ncbi:hypothetical protein NL676_010893 [Syzygium grande]|nr:hypothetical protein NL676_010893 [Syzygium grande]
MLHLSNSNGSAIVVIVNDARIQQRQFDEVRTIARYRFGAPCGNAHVAAGALLADKNGEIVDGKDHRFFEDSPGQEKRDGSETKPSKPCAMKIP